MKKKTYRVRNWPEYNKALESRGSLTVWFDEKLIAEWHHKEPSGKRGRPYLYTNLAILCALTLRNLFRLPLQATEGFIKSLITMLRLPLVAPDYTTLSKRQSCVEIPAYVPKKNERIHLVVDSSGIKIYGEGEWEMRLYGKGKRRTWRKLHIAVNEKTHDIVTSIVTDSNVHDTEIFDQLLPCETDCTVEQMTGDGAYDAHKCYNATERIGARPCFPPREGAARHKPTHKAQRLRNRTVGRVRAIGLKRWKVENSYHRRSMAEVAFARLKKIFGDRVASRIFKNQATELSLRCYMLNKMNALGMPDSIII